MKKNILIDRKDIQVIYEGNSLEESLAIREKIIKKLREKSDLMQQRRALRKIKSNAIQYLIDDIEKELRDRYFEINVYDLLTELNCV